MSDKVTFCPKCFDGYSDENFMLGICCGVPLQERPLNDDEKYSREMAIRAVLRRGNHNCPNHNGCPDCDETVQIYQESKIFQLSKQLKETQEQLEALKAENEKLRKSYIEQEEKIKQAGEVIHWPECWDIAAYPELHDAVSQAVAGTDFDLCGTCETKITKPEKPVWFGVDWSEGYIKEKQAGAIRKAAQEMVNAVVVPKAAKIRQEYYKAAICHAVQFFENYASTLEQKEDK